MLAVFFAAAVTTVALPPSEIKACLGVETVYANWTSIARQKATLSPEAWQDACRQARDANERRLSLTKAIRETGSSPLKEFQGSTRWIKRANAASDPDLVQLFQRVFEAELPRITGGTSKTPITAGLSPVALNLYDGLRAVDAVAADATNTEWLRAAVSRRGWFTISRDGAEADSAARLIVQHADADVAFKGEMIKLIEPLIEAGESNRQTFPSMYDRWAAGAGKPLRFGFQGACKAKGVWESLPLEDPDHVDERRRLYGISTTFAEEVANNSKRCG